MVNKVRLADVASEAGVAVSTVSRVFSNPNRVNIQTLRHVRAVAKRLGYVPSAHHLKSRSDDGIYGQNDFGLGEENDSHLFAMLVNDASNGVGAQILKGAQLSALESNSAVSLIEIGDSVMLAQHLVDNIIDKLDGLILCTDKLSVSKIQKLYGRIPVVMMNRPLEGVPSVIPDPLLGVARTLMLLRRYDLRTIAYVAGSHSEWANESRWETLSRLCQYFSMELRQIGSVKPSIEGGMQAAIALESALPDVVVCFNDLIAAGVVRKFGIDGIRVPADVSVVGFDSTLVAPMVNPPITTVRIPRAQMGQTAVNMLLGNKAMPALNLHDAELLMKLREHGIFRKEYDPLAVQIDTSLMIRGSVARKGVENALISNQESVPADFLSSR